MAHKAANTDVDPQIVADAQDMWARFTALAKWSSIAAALILTLMAFFIL